MEALAESYHYELAGQGIESSVIEPGAYQTAVFGNMVTAADHARTETYGAAAQIPTRSQPSPQWPMLRKSPTRF